jgi:hypothetical protein
MSQYIELHDAAGRCLISMDIIVPKIGALNIRPKEHKANFLEHGMNVFDYISANL